MTDHDSPPDPADDEEMSDIEVHLAANDLDGDGEVSAVEDARATLGVVDAKLEELEEAGGVKGRIAGAARRITDKLDND